MIHITRARRESEKKKLKRNNHHKRLLSEAITLKLFLCRLYTHRYVNKSIRVHQIKYWPNTERNGTKEKRQTKYTIERNSSWTNNTKNIFNQWWSTHAHTQRLAAALNLFSRHCSTDRCEQITNAILIFHIQYHAITHVLFVFLQFSMDKSIWFVWIDGCVHAVVRFFCLYGIYLLVQWFWV